MFHIILLNPEIPANTGNIIRLCANTGTWLHLIRPLGFSMDDVRLRRAGLDYHEYARVQTHDSLANCLRAADPRRLHACSARGTVSHVAPVYRPGDGFLFGCETRGLPDHLRQHLPETAVLRLPMVAGSRSINLSNAVAVVVYEAWRQIGFAGGA